MTKPAITVRIATTNDLSSITELDVIAQRENSRLEAIATALSRKQCWVAEAVDSNFVAISGYGILDRSFFGQHFIPLVVVRSSMRRQGIARTIMETLDAQCRGEKLFTSANQSNLPMRKLLLGAGFVESGFIDHLDPGDPEIVYVRL
ncbi:N-acetyltransferase domain-containing protein [Cupriavidus necator]|uniref:GNAT family N-acetyltransferase n=1 Tax=Cupriavidus necator TaxID=106590 RepID=UPI003F734971